MKLRSVLVLVVLAVLAASCSGDDPPAGQSSETTQATATTDLSPTSGVPATTAAATTSGDSATGGLSGVWDGELTHLSSTGSCPSTPTQRGTVLIDQTEAAFTIVFEEGFTCDPLEACAFSGTVEGSEYSATNGGVADSEGGVYTTSFILVMDSVDHAEGLGESSYTLADMTCTWDTTLELVGRKE